VSVNFLERNNALLLKEPCLMMLSFLNLLRLHMLLSVEVKGVMFDRSNASLASNLDILLIVAVRSFVIIASSGTILSLIVPPVLHGQHNIRCKHFMPLQALQLVLPSLIHLVVVLYNLK
jgi:hypothetical protein